MSFFRYPFVTFHGTIFGHRQLLRGTPTHLSWFLKLIPMRALLSHGQSLRVKNTLNVYKFPEIR